MRILIHSNAPWVPSGYGLQTRMLMDTLRRQGHTVGVSAFSGLAGADIKWRGYQIMASGQMAFGLDMLIPHIQRFEADLTVTLMDVWKLEGIAGALRNFAVAAWLPTDCSPLSRLDLATLTASGIHPIAMSQFGLHQLELAGFVPSYVPHAVDTSVFAPMEDRTEFRKELDLDDKFVIGICAANKDSTRKAFAEQFEAFHRLQARHAECVLLVHSTPRNVGGLNLYQMVEDMGIAEHVQFTDQYLQDAGLIGDDMMSRWYSALDVLSLCSYAEGFGIPLIQAQACGTPVITTDGSAMRELVPPGNGWLVAADDFWNPVHRAWWKRPRITDIYKAYLAAYNSPTAHNIDRRACVREFAMAYDVHTVADRWEHILKDMEQSCT